MLTANLICWGISSQHEGFSSHALAPDGRRASGALVLTRTRAPGALVRTRTRAPGASVRTCTHV